MNSKIYVGTVMHQRHKPKKHILRYRVFSMLLNLEELPSLGRRFRFFSHNAFNLFSIYDKDFGGGDGTSLLEYARSQLEQYGLGNVDGPVMLLAYPRILGFVFNPLSVYYCFHQSGELGACLYEVNNTFGQRHSYLIPINHKDPKVSIHRCRKNFYVSPFINMDVSYEFKVEAPEQRLVLSIGEYDDHGKLLDAVFSGKERAISDGVLLKMFITHPLMTLKVVAGIHWEALKLWLKKIPLVPRPAPPENTVTVLD